MAYDCIGCDSPIHSDGCILYNSRLLAALPRVVLPEDDVNYVKQDASVDFNKHLKTAADAQKAAKVPVWQGVFAYFSNALLAVGTVSRFGANKHLNGKMPTKWREYPVDTYSDALARHILEENRGSVYDSESHLLHAAHEAWNALARLEKLLETEPLKSELYTNVRHLDSQGSGGTAKNQCQSGVRVDETKSTFGRLA